MIADYGDANVNANPKPDKSETAAGEEVARLLDQAKKGDAAVLPQLRRLLDESPELWQYYGDLAAQACASWVQLAAGQNLLLDECLTRKAAELQKEIAGATPSPLEQHLADRVVVS